MTWKPVKVKGKWRLQHWYGFYYNQGCGPLEWDSKEEAIEYANKYSMDLYLPN